MIILSAILHYGFAKWNWNKYVNCSGCTFYDGVGINFFSKTKKV